MRKSRAAAGVFAFLGLLVAVLGVFLALTRRNAEPWMIRTPAGAVRCAEELLDGICRGDYAGASQYLCGTPTLMSREQREDPVSRQIWEAFVASLSYELSGECTVSSDGISQRVRIRGLDIPGTVSGLRDIAEALLEARVAAAENPDEIYDSSNGYREDFVSRVLTDAAAQAVAAGTVTERELTLQLIYDRDRWWVIPDAALLNALAGGILE